MIDRINNFFPHWFNVIQESTADYNEIIMYVGVALMILSMFFLNNHTAYRIVYSIALPTVIFSMIFRETGPSAFAPFMFFLGFLTVVMWIFNDSVEKKSQESTQNNNDDTND